MLLGKQQIDKHIKFHRTNLIAGFLTVAIVGNLNDDGIAHAVKAQLGEIGRGITARGYADFHYQKPACSGDCAKLSNTADPLRGLASGRRSESGAIVRPALSGL